MKKYGIFILLIFLTKFLFADISLPSLVNHNMVLQRDKPIKLWGYGFPDEAVHISFNGHHAHTVTGRDGTWRLGLPAMSAGGPFDMVIEGQNKIVLTNILLGDVWVCSGQSNMEFNLQDDKFATEEVKNSNHPRVRIFNIQKAITLTPHENAQGSWQICKPESAAYTTAIGYYFAKKIHSDLNIPIGIINASWGGTVIESWISSEGLSEEPTFGPIAKDVPVFDIDAYNKKQDALHKEWLKKFNANDKGMVNRQPIWAETAIHDWNKINLPTGWEFTGKEDLKEMDGIVWFNKNIELSSSDLKSDLTVFLGVLLNADQAYWNGHKIGVTEDSWGVKREYVVAKQLLKKGINRLTVRIENYGGDGGFMDTPDALFIQTAGRQISLNGEWAYKIGYRQTQYDRPEKAISPNTLPTLMYNNLISPITSFSIKGFLWYQGESNWFRGYQYRSLFRMMIRDWRHQFEDNSLWFFYVQLANYHEKLKYPGDSWWAEVREAQDMGRQVPMTAMVTAIDVGDPLNIHPADKRTLGYRLADVAKKLAYNQPTKPFSPEYLSYAVQADKILINLNHVYEGIKAKAEEVSGFQISGSDRKWQWAQAKITSHDQITVWHPDITQPTAVRYAWEDNPESANLINSEGLPLFPFRTDDDDGLSRNNVR